MPDRAGVKISWHTLFSRIFLPSRDFSSTVPLLSTPAFTRYTSYIESIVPSSTRLGHTVHQEDQSRKGLREDWCLGSMLANARSASQLTCGWARYCFGSVMAVRLAHTDSVNTIVVAHPASVTPAQIRAIKVPTSWALAEDEMSFKDKDVKTAQEIFKEQEVRLDHVDYEFNTWKGKFLFLVMATSRNLIQSTDDTCPKLEAI
ncbi:hypothetical protein BJV78DRAFT_64272 [Lactifluus subvellereus]|nr:hypothetical protein BJV78DRAFT_64272 [Lactifluus subvellereus]